jgi:hypothetical protein
MLRRMLQGVLSPLGYKLVALEAARPTWGLTRFFSPAQGFWVQSAAHLGCRRQPRRLDPGGGPLLPGRRLHPHRIARRAQAQPRRPCVAATRSAGSIGGREASQESFRCMSPRKDQSSSFLDIPRIKDEAVRKTEVPLRTLDEIRSSLSLPVPEMLEIDAEGLDLKVPQRNHGLRRANRSDSCRGRGRTARSREFGAGPAPGHGRLRLPPFRHHRLASRAFAGGAMAL